MFCPWNKPGRVSSTVAVAEATEAEPQIDATRIENATTSFFTENFMLDLPKLVRLWRILVAAEPLDETSPLGMSLAP